MIEQCNICGGLYASAQHEMIAGTLCQCGTAEGENIRREMNERDFAQAMDLWAAGWKAERPHQPQEDIMSWYWRRPGKRKGTKGRLFLSTNQAHNALLRESLQNASGQAVANPSARPHNR